MAKFVEEEELEDLSINLLAVRDYETKEIVKYIKREDYDKGLIDKV